MKCHDCADYIANPNKKLTKITVNSEGAYEEQWIGACTVCGRRYAVIRITKYELSPVPEDYRDESTDFQ